MVGVVFLEFFQNAPTGIAAGSLLRAHAPQDPAPVVQVSSTAFAGVAADTTLSAAGLQDRLARNILSIHNVYKDSIKISRALDGWQLVGSMAASTALPFPFGFLFLFTEF